MIIILPLKVENVNKFGKNNQTRIYLLKLDNENLSDKKWLILKEYFHSFQCYGNALLCPTQQPEDTKGKSPWKQ